MAKIEKSPIISYKMLKTRNNWFQERMVTFSNNVMKTNTNARKHTLNARKHVQRACFCMFYRQGETLTFHHVRDPAFFPASFFFRMIHETYICLISLGLASVHTLQQRVYHGASKNVPVFFGTRISNMIYRTHNNVCRLE